jgi:tetratricopeptide (TPR) repeat protein
VALAISRDWYLKGGLAATAASCTAIGGVEIGRNKSAAIGLIAVAAGSGLGVFADKLSTSQGGHHRLLELGPGWNDAAFAKRSGLLRELKAAARTSAGPGHPRMVVLSGEPGGGATELARQYVQKDRRYDPGFRLDASSPLALRGSFERLAVNLGLEVQDRLELVVRRVWAELAKRDRWALIYDNAELTPWLRTFFPELDNGFVMLVVRDDPRGRASDERGREIHVPSPPKLAESQVRWDSRDADGKRLLAFLAQFGQSEIPVGLIPDALRGGLAQLREERLLSGTEPEAETPVVILRSSIREHVRQTLSPQEAEQALRTAMAAMLEAFPRDPADSAVWQVCGYLVPHVEVVVDSAATLEVMVRSRAVLCLYAGRYLHLRGELRSAVDYLELALAAANWFADPELESDIRLSLGSTLYNDNKLAEARERTEEAIGDREALKESAAKVRWHAEALLVLHRISREQGRHQEALAEIRAARQIWEELDGIRSHGVGVCLRAESRALAKANEPQQAAEVAEQALHLLEEIHGPDHRDVGEALTVLGLSQRDLGRFEDAEQTLKRAYEVLLATDGPDAQESTVKAGEYLAGVMIELGSTGAAGELLNRVLESRLKYLGPDHPNVAMIHLFRSDLFRREGEWANALAEADEAARIYSAYPEGHPYRDLAGARRDAAAARRRP